MLYPLQTAARSLLLATACLVLFFALRADSAEAQGGGPTAAKPNMAEVYEAANQPLEEDPEVNYVDVSLATAEDLFGDDVPTVERTVRYSQEVVVENLSSTISVCVFTVAPGAACTTDADASCRGGSDPKALVAPSKSRKFRISGTRKPCAITSAVAGEYQAERVVRLVGAR